MTGHARLSPSARHRWGVCPASVRECAKYPEKPSGKAAIDGTHTHTLLERCLVNDVPASSLIGQELEDHEGKFVVDIERAERVQFALDYVADHYAKMESTFGECTLIAEQKVDPKYIFQRDDLGGSVDVQLISGDMIEIIDYKDGINPVDAKDNPQMEMYGFGAIDPYVRDRVQIPFKSVRLTIIQPKLRLKGLSGIDSHVYTIDEFMKKIDGIKVEAAATDDPNAPFVPGESQCKYCDHKGACGALTNQMLEASGIQFGNIEVAKQAAEKEPSELTNEQLRELVESAPLLRQLLEAAEAEAQRRMEAGQVIEGLKLVKGRGGNRKWAFDEEEMAAKLTKMGIPKAVVWETKLITPAKVEKLTWAKRDGTQKQLSERQMKTIHDEYITKSDGKLTVVSSSDSREAVTMSAASLFGAVAEVPSWLN